MNTRPELMTVEPGTQVRHLTCSRQMIRREYEGSPALPGDESISQRALLVAATRNEPTRLSNLNRGLSVSPLITALSRLGARIVSDGDEVVVSSLLGSVDKERVHTLNLGSSGTSARLLLGMLAGFGIPAVIDGDRSLREQPMDWVVNPLLQLGARIEYLLKPGRLPIRVFSRRMRGGDVRIAGGGTHAREAVLLAAFVAQIPVRIIQPVHARDHIERLLRSLGAAIASDGTSLSFQPAAYQRYLAHRIPNDPSAAAYLIAGHLLQGRVGEMRIDDVCLNPTRTGFVELLRRAGLRINYLDTADIHGEQVGAIVVVNGRSKLAPFGNLTQAESQALADEAPLAAAVASQIDGIAEFPRASDPAASESTRIDTTCSMLRSFGIEAEATRTVLRIVGGKPFIPGSIPCFNDHRLAMTAAVAGCAAAGVTRILQGGCHATSFPSFTSVMRWYGFDVSDEDRGGDPA